MKIEARPNNSLIKQPCVTCGTWGRPDEVAYFVDGQEWACDACVAGGVGRIREGLRAQAERCRRMAASLEEAAADHIEIMPPSPEVQGEIKRLEREREEYERQARKARMAGRLGPDLPFLEPGPRPRGGWMPVPDFNAPKRSELLAKYTDKPVTRYTQFDGFIDAEADSFVRPDEDGDALFSRTTYELMGFNYGVRVLIPDNISAVAAARALTKIADFVEEALEDQRRRQRNEPGDTEDDDMLF